jgi:hypothetical protein
MQTSDQLLDGPRNAAKSGGEFFRSGFRPTNALCGCAHRIRMQRATTRSADYVAQRLVVALCSIKR